MDERAVFLTLTPSDNLGLAADAFRLLHNHSRYLKPSPLGVDNGSSRETTPLHPSAEENPVINLEEFHRIQLKFDQESRVKGRVSFGSDPKRCDVLLAPKKGQYGTSGLHFYITFDDQQRPVVKDVSTNGLIVSYDSQAKDELRKNFQWIIFPNFTEITVRLGTKKGPVLDVRLPTHYKTHLDEYKSKAKRFMAGAPRDPLQAFNDLALRSADTSLALSEALSPIRRPVYLKFKELGKGNYGRVYMAVNASTGFEYAGKEFFHGKARNKEIDIMRGLRHEHIIRFVDFQKERNPLLVMEYLPLGNLAMQHQNSRIVDTDMMVIFRQCLGALDYLHSSDITHRDLKPQNILVSSRSPIGIKLADFGMAHDKSDLETFCGSAEYAAPEIFQGCRYTNTVDIWSLAVLVMEFIYGLPRCKQPEPMGELRPWGYAWCNVLIVKANDEDSDILIDFLTGHMLRRKPQERLSAAKCLHRAAEIGLFSATSYRTGEVTPRLQPHRGTDIHPEDASIMVGPLRQHVRTPQENTGRVPRSQSLSPSFLPECEVAQPSSAGLEGSSHDEGPTTVFRTSGYSPTKRRRTTNGLHHPNLEYPHSDQKPDSSQTAPGPREKEPLNSIDYRTRQDMSDQKLGNINDLSRTPSIPQLLERRGDFVVQVAEGHQVSIRISDARVNFTGATTTTGPWIGFEDARKLCSTIHLDEKLRPLLEFGEGLGAQIPSVSLSKARAELRTADFAPITSGATTIFVRNADSWINGTQILQAAGYTRQNRPFAWNNQKFQHQVVRGCHSGVYVPLEVGINLCDKFDLPEIGALLREKSLGNMTILHTAIPRSGDFQFVEADKHTVAMRKSDLKINLTQVLKAARKPRQEVQKFKRENFTIEVVRGGSKIQGSYIDFSLAVNICQLYRLSLTTETLIKLKSADIQRGESLRDTAIERPPTATEITKGASHLVLPDTNIDQDYAEIDWDNIDGLFRMSRPSSRFMTPIQASHQSGFNTNRHSFGNGQSNNNNIDDAIPEIDWHEIDKLLQTSIPAAQSSLNE